MSQPSLPDHDIVQLDAKATLRSLMSIPANDDAQVVVRSADGRVVVMTGRAWRELLDMLQHAPNRALAGRLMDMPLGSLLDKAAYPSAGEMDRPVLNSGAAVLEGIGIRWSDLQTRGQSAKPPTPAIEATSKGILDLPSGGGFGVSPTMSPAPLVVTAGKPVEPESLSMTEKEQIRLDVATPEGAVVDQSFDVAVAIRQLGSPPLKVDDLVKLTSTEGTVFRAANTDIVKYRVELEAKDCEVEPPSYTFLLEKGKDSLVQYFQVMPKRAGSMSIVVNAYQADDGVLAATTRVRLKAAVQVVDQADVSGPDNALGIKLYELLGGEGFALEDLQDVAFRLNVDWENIGGDTKRAKARALVQLFDRRNALKALGDVVKIVRPDVLL